MYQIGIGFTRLEPGINIAAAMQHQAQGEPCVIGNPSVRMKAVHCPALVNAWHRLLIRALAQPMQLEVRKGHRRFQNLGCAIFDMEPNGTVQTYKWHVDANGVFQLQQLPAYSVAADGAPYGALWMNHFKAAALHALQTRFPGKAEFCGYYVDWAGRQLMDLCWGTMVQEAVRERVAQDLNLDCELLQVAALIQLSSQPRKPVRFDAYNHVVEYAAEFRLLLKEAPQLIPLYALLAKELQVFDPDGRFQLTSRIKRFLLSQGIRPVMWRLVCQEGTPWLQAALAFHNFERETLAYIAVDLLRVVQAFGIRKAPPSWLLVAMMQLGGNPNAPGANFNGRLDDLYPLCARLGHLAAQADAAQLVRMQEYAQPVFNWASDHLAKVSLRTIRQAPFDWFVRQADVQAQEDAAKLHRSAPWDMPYELDTGSNDVTAVVLNSPLEVWREGRSMRHCAANYIKPCAKGAYLMVSLRPANSGRPLATAGYALDRGHVRLDKVSGFANALVEPRIHGLVTQCLEQLRSQAAKNYIAPDPADMPHALPRMDKEFP